MAFTELLNEINKRAKGATPGPWIWADWTIYDEDREAQKRKEPYWTLVNSYSRNLCRGPLGRKSLEIESIASGGGRDESWIDVSDADAEFIAHSRDDIPKLLAVIEKLIAQRNDIIRLYYSELEFVENTKNSVQWCMRIGNKELAKILEK